MITFILIYILVAIYIFIWHILLTLYNKDYILHFYEEWNNHYWNRPTRFYKLICLIFYPIVFLIVILKLLLRVISVYLFNK